MKRKQTRKEKLRAHAEAYELPLAPTRENIVLAYIDGYKAAMRDARRALRDGDWVPLYDSGINKFLRPIR